MKKFYIFCAVVMALLAGCQRPEIINNQYYASVESFGDYTKTSKTKENNIVWSIGDRIAVFERCSVADEYVLAAGYAGKSNAVFKKVSGGNTFVGGTEMPCKVALYPYAEGLVLTGSALDDNVAECKIKNVMLPAKQDYSRNSFGNGVFPMVAITDNEDENLLEFKNVLGAVKLQLKGSKVVNSIKIEGRNGEVLSGQAVITANSDNKTNSIEMVGSDESSKSVTLDCGGCVKLSTSLATEFIIALPPVTFSKGFTVTVTYSDDTQQTFEAIVENTVYRSSILVMPVCLLDGEGESVPDGMSLLFDTGYSLYYDNSLRGLSDEITLVLSNGACRQNRLDEPYLVSDGEMVVITIKTPYSLANGTVSLPTGEFDIIENNDDRSVESYVVKAQGGESTKWDIKSGSVVITAENDGIYTIATENLLLKNESGEQEAGYICKSFRVLTDYYAMAPFNQSLNGDIVDMPFHYFDCKYYGNLYGNGTGNFLVSMATKGFVEVDETGTENMTGVPGVYLSLNFFSRLYADAAEPILEEGRYNVSGTSSDQLLSRGTLMPGMTMSSSDGEVPFGTFIILQSADGEEETEFISGGYVDIAYYEDYCIMTYELTTSKRTVSGVWKGAMSVNNLSSSESETLCLTTLDQDVECDMSKITGGTLTFIETLNRRHEVAELNYDIAEAWQLYLGPNDWIQEDQSIPMLDAENKAGADGVWGTADDFMYDKNKNGIQDRLEALFEDGDDDGDGDVMILEFILPLGSQGVIAPELNKTYTYTMQPNLSRQAEMYEIYVSRMGRPTDEIFDARYAQELKGWAEQLGITSYDRCNARRGFTWSEDGFRGNWYLHYEKDQNALRYVHAPAINGWVKVTRTGDDTYNFEWDFIDDKLDGPNKITGKVDNVKVCLLSSGSAT